MKTYQIEVQKVKAMANGHGLIEARIDAIVTPRTARDEEAASTLLSMSEDTARILFMLLKAQLGEVDRRKGRSQR